MDSIRSSPEREHAAVASPELSAPNNTSYFLPPLQDIATNAATRVVGLASDPHALLAQANDEMPTAALPSPETSGDDLSPTVGSSSNKLPEALAQVAVEQEPKDKRPALPSLDSTKHLKNLDMSTLENRWGVNRFELTDILATFPARHALQVAAPADDSIPAIAGSLASPRPVEPREYFAPRQPLLRLETRAQDATSPAVQHSAFKPAPLLNIPPGAVVPVVGVSGLKDSLKNTKVGPYMRDSHVPVASQNTGLYSGRSHNDKLQLRRIDFNDLKEQSKRLSADGCTLCAMEWAIKCSGDLCYLCASEKDFATAEGGQDQSRVSVPVGSNIEPDAERPEVVSDAETIPDPRWASPEPAVAGASKEALAMTDHDLQEANLRVLLDVASNEYEHNERELQAKAEAMARKRKIENTIKEQNRASGMKNKSDSSLSSLSSSPPDPFKEKPIEVTIDDNHNIENVQLPSPAMAPRHHEDEPTGPRKERPTYDEFALPPRYEPTAAAYSNVRGDGVNNFGSRKRSRSIDPSDDYPVPVFDNMLIAPERQVYKRKVSGRTTTISPQQHWNQLTSGMDPQQRQTYSDSFEQRHRAERLTTSDVMEQRLQTERKERKGREAFEGWNNYASSQRGWNSQSEPEHQEKLEKSREKEAPKLQAESEKKAHSRPPLNKKQKLGEELDAAMRAVVNRRDMEVMAVHELAEQKAKELKDYMANSKVDMDKIIAEAHGRRKKTSSGGSATSHKSVSEKQAATPSN